MHINKWVYFHIVCKLLLHAKILEQMEKFVQLHCAGCAPCVTLGVEIHIFWTQHQPKKHCRITFNLVIFSSLISVACRPAVSDFTALLFDFPFCNNLLSAIVPNIIENLNFSFVFSRTRSFYQNKFTLIWSTIKKLKLPAKIRSCLKIESNIFVSPQ